MLINRLFQEDGSYLLQESGSRLHLDVGTTALPGGVTGVPYHQAIVTPGNTAYTVSVVSGALPAGLSLLQGANRNKIRNPYAGGAVAGSPGTLPTNWIGTATLDGVTRSVVGTGTDVTTGLPYVDIRLSGTSSTGGTQIPLTFDSTTLVTASVGQTWVHSIYLAVVGGSKTNFTAINLRHRYYNSGGSALTARDTTMLSALSGTLTRFTNTGYTATDALTASTMIMIAVDYVNSSAIDITLRIAGIQLEQASSATDYADPRYTYINGTPTTSGDSVFTLRGDDGSSITDGVFSIGVIPGVTTAVTEGADSPAANITQRNSVTTAVTEGADISAVSVTQTNSVTTAVTENVDTAATNVAQINVVTSAVAEGFDTSTVAVSQINEVVATVTESADTPAVSVEIVNTITSAITENTDTAAASVEIVNGVSSTVTENADVPSATISQLNDITTNVVEQPDVPFVAIIEAGQLISNVTEGADTAQASIDLIQYVEAVLNEAQDAAAAAIEFVTEVTDYPKGGAAKKRIRIYHRQNWQLPYILEEEEEEVPVTVIKAINSVVTAVERQYVKPTLETTETALEVLLKAKKSLQRVRFAETLKIKLIQELEKMEAEIEEEEEMFLLMEDVI